MDNNSITREKLILYTGFSDSKVYRGITSLNKKGYIERKGSNKSGKWNILK